LHELLDADLTITRKWRIKETALSNSESVNTLREAPQARSPHQGTGIKTRLQGDENEKCSVRTRILGGLLGLEYGQL